MSSDDYFDDSEQLDSAFIAEMDAIEAAHSNATQFPSQANPTRTTRAPSTSITSYTRSSSTTSNPPGEFTLKDVIPSKPQPTLKPTRVLIDVDADESYDQFFDNIDPLELEILDKDVEQAYKHGPSMPRSSLASGSSAIRQLTLFGDTLLRASPRPLRQIQVKPPHSPHKPFGKKARKVKKWDHTAFAKSGWKSNKGKGKTKDKTMDYDEGADDAFHSTEEFEQFPALIPESMSFKFVLSYCKH